MKILLTNDDGYNSLGIRLLFRKLKKYGDVIICAPKEHMSAKSCSITIGKPLKLVKEEENIYSLDGTPADCVAFGLTSLNEQFDLVISGCNKGWNICWDTLFSGTIGACSQSLICRTPCIAFSSEDNFDIVNNYFDDVMQYIINYHLLSLEHIVSVNFPFGKEAIDIKLTKQYYRDVELYFEKDEEGNYLAKRKFNQEDFPLDSDIYCVNNKIISISLLNKML